MKEKRENNASLDNQKKTYSFIEKIPGIHFRELQRRMNIGRGTLEYQVRKLLKRGLIHEEHNHFRRFYILGIPEQERLLLALLRNDTYKKILLALLQNHTLNHKQIMRLSLLSASSTSEHLKKLCEKGFIFAEKRGREKEYQITDEKEFMKTLIIYRKSFFDTLIDQFIEMWD